MNNKQTPLQLDGINESIYPGFGDRLGSLLLDLIFVLPVTIFTIYVNKLGLYVHLITVLPTLAFTIWYNIYLTKEKGGTPGKTVINLRVIRIDGQPIGWREAILRHSVMLVLTLLSTIVAVIGVFQADADTFNSLSGDWIKQAQYMGSFNPGFNMFYMWAANIWVYSELIVMLTNKRKRAIHDYIAGTVIVKAKYLNKIWETMHPSEEPVA